MWQLRNGGGVAFLSSFSLLGFGGNWNRSNFESATAQATEPLSVTIKRHHTRKNTAKKLPSTEQQNFINFKHIAKGRNANNTFAKSLKSTFFNFACNTQKIQIQIKNAPMAHFL
jgi:hypothetical protein